MNKKIEFYFNLLTYLRLSVKNEYLVNSLVDEAKEAGISWDASSENIHELYLAVNLHSQIEDEDEWSIILNDCAKQAFKDLSPLKNRRAMEIFDQLAQDLLPGWSEQIPDMILWARTIKERPDGSAIIVLHTTDLERLRGILERHSLADRSSELRTLEKGVLIGS